MFHCGRGRAVVCALVLTSLASAAGCAGVEQAAKPALAEPGVPAALGQPVPARMFGLVGDRTASTSEWPPRPDATPSLTEWSVAAGLEGVVFVSTRSDDRVYALVDANGDHRVDRVQIVASGLEAPDSIAYRDGSLYVTVISRILRIDDVEASLEDPRRALRVPDQPAERGHQGWRYIRFGRDGWLYIPTGPQGTLLVSDDYEGA